MAGHFALTRTTTTTFDHPVRVGKPYRVEARIEVAGDDRIEASAVVTDEEGRRCVRARAEFTPLGPAQAADAVGKEVSGDSARFLRKL